MNSITRYISENTIRENMFMFSGIVLQIIAYLCTDASVLSLVSGICGVVAVVLCAQRKICQYYWSFAQLGTYMVLAYQQKFYGEIYENIFYIVTMIWGIYLWRKNYDNENDEVNIKSLSAKGVCILIFFMTLCCYLLFSYLRTTEDTQPLMDTISTIPAFFAQILFVLRYKENWYCWLIIDVTSIFMWINADDYIMAVQFIFWSINCLYGLKKWTNNKQSNI